MRNLITSLRKPTASDKEKGRAESSNESRISSALDRRQGNVVKALDVAIQTIDAVNKLVPITMAKNILTGISSILVLLQANLKNKDDLKGLLRNCEDICSTLALATKGVSIDRMSEVLRNALDALQSSIDDLKLRVEDALQRGRVRRLLGASLDVKEISAWTTELDGIFTSFSARLNIVSVIRLEQMYNLLQQSDVPNLIPDPPPPPPAMFFGREELLQEIKDALLRDEGVALIGPGGIGKSTLAMAVLNEEDIIQHYRRRFFVTYEGLSAKTMTFSLFLDQIAGVLGLPMSGAEGERQIKTNLGLSPVLLVLDNAETFEDAMDRDDAMRISNFIARVANTPGVTVILTSRTSSNARRVSWTQFDVPPLEKEPARLSFRKIYHGEITDDEIDALLAAVDFHPLSISILAYTAKENRWSAKVLLDRWKLQRGEILQTGDGKDNLGFTIQLSLESPSVKMLGDDAVRVLHIIAFLPQGINQDHLTRLFPSVPRISTIMDTLCKVSLVYTSTTFLTMLAPIRLFLETLPTTGLELLKDICSTYYVSLEAISKEKDSHADLLISDHLNIEHLIAFDVAHSPLDMRTITSTCYLFLLGLKCHKPRPTSLGSVISSLPEETAVEKDSKALCLDALGDLYFTLSNFSFASTASSAAHLLFIVVGNHTMAAGCVSTTGLSYTTRGNHLRAQQLLGDFIHSSSWQHIDEKSRAEIYFVLDISRMHSSAKGADNLFLRSMDYSWRSLESHIFHWRARMHHGYSTPEEVERQLKPLQSDCISSAEVWDHWTFFEALADAAFLQRRFDAGIQLLNQAQESVNGHFLPTVIILALKAAVASSKGDYDLSRSLLQDCINTLSVVATPSSGYFLSILYIQGRNELYAGNYLMARQLLVDVVEHCGAYGVLETGAFCMRALGETELLLGQKAYSDRYFAQTTELCEEAGTPPELLGVCEPMLILDDDRFPGWKRFLVAARTAVSF